MLTQLLLLIVAIQSPQLVKSEVKNHKTMDKKYFEYIALYLLVIIASIVIAAIAQISALGIGADEFTANTVFWVFAGLGVSIITNIIPIRVKDLRPIDLYHYGWEVILKNNIT